MDFGDVRIVQSCRMSYPPLAKRAQIEGEVMVEVTCAPDGRVISVQGLQGNEIFRDAVMDCLRATRYGEQPIPFRFRQPFRLSWPGPGAGSPRLDFSRHASRIGTTLQNGGIPWLFGPKANALFTLFRDNALLFLGLVRRQGRRRRTRSGFLRS